MSIDFGPLREASVLRYRRVADRQLFYYLLHVDEHADVLPTALDRAHAWLKAVDAQPEYIGWLAYLDSYDEFVAALASIPSWFQRREEEVALAVGDLPRDRCAELLRQFAPTGLLDGCWLQNVSSAASSHTVLACGLLKIYSAEIGDGDPAHHHGNAFREMLQSLGIYLPDVASFAFTEELSIGDAAFTYSVFLLAISQFPRTFASEILGLTLFHRLCGIGPLPLALRERIRVLGGSTRFLDLHARREAVDGPTADIAELVRGHIEAGGSPDNEQWRMRWEGVRRGFLAAARGVLESLERGLRFLESPSASPEEKMIELLRRKARHAHGYHREALIEGKAIDEWLDPARIDAPGFLAALARSRHVKPGDAAGSAMFRRLLAFRGPMFRIFSPEEMKVIAEWIDSLPEQGEWDASPPNDATVGEPAPETPSPRGWSDPPLALDQNFERESHRRYAKKPLGELYHYLLNVEHYPDVRPFARSFATRWLGLAGRRIERGSRAIPFLRYEHQSLDAWLDVQHRRQVESYRPSQGPPPQTREELIEATVQQAPMILIDGAWIQHASRAGTSHTRVGSILFHIFADEVGNGDVELNHPNVFRELLAEMGVDMPPFGTLEFGRWPRFRPQAFRVPVFWLSISQYPKSFLAETLGLNLAMELSGVGGAYRVAIDSLRYYGYDPVFIELHNTIDNVSTGHAAWAVDAIKCYMDEVLSLGGAELVDEHWRRVWTGYRALTPPEGLWGWFGRLA